MNSLKFTTYMVVAMFSGIVFLASFAALFGTAVVAVQYLMGEPVALLKGSPITLEFFFAVPVLAFLLMWACAAAIFKALDWSTS